MRELLAEAYQAILNLVGENAKITGCTNGVSGGCGYCTCCRIGKVLGDADARLGDVRMWVDSDGSGWLLVGKTMWLMPDHGFGWRCSGGWRAKDLPSRFEITDAARKAAALETLQRWLNSNS